MPWIRALHVPSHGTPRNDLIQDIPDTSVTFPMAGPAHDHHLRSGCSTHYHGILHRHPAQPGALGRARVRPSQYTDTCRQDQHRRYDSRQKYYAPSTPPAESIGLHSITYRCSRTNGTSDAGRRCRASLRHPLSLHLAHSHLRDPSILVMEAAENGEGDDCANATT